MVSAGLMPAGNRVKLADGFPDGGTDDPVDFGDWDGGSFGEVIVSLLILQPAGVKPAMPRSSGLISAVQDEKGCEHQETQDDASAPEEDLELSLSRSH